MNWKIVIETDESNCPFARKSDETLFGNIHEGWDVWGNEVESDIAI